MADIGDLVVRLSMEVGGAKRELANISKGFKQLDSVMKNAAMGASEFGNRLDKMASKRSQLDSLIKRQTELNKVSKKSIDIDKEAYAARQQKLKDFMVKYDEYVRKHGVASKTLENQRIALEKSVARQQKRILYKEGRFDKDVEKLGEYKKALQEIEQEYKKLEGLNSKIGLKGIKFFDFGQNALDIGRKQLGTGQVYDMYVGKRARSLLKSVATEFIQYESAFANVSKTVNGTDAELARLNDDIQAMSLRLPESTEAIANVAASAGQLGIAVPNIAGFTEVMVGLSSATNLGNNAAPQLAQFANIMGMNQKDFDRLGSVIVELGNNSATTESAIVEMGMRLAGAGKQVGMSSAEVMGLAAALSSVGIEAQAGGTAFSKVMSDMLLQVETGGKRLEEYAKVSGMSTEGFSSLFRQNASEAIRAFIVGLSQMNEAGINSIQILDEMGLNEIRLRDALLRSSNASDLFTKSTKMANAAWRENTALTKEVDKRNKTTDSRLKVLGNKGKQIARDFGQTLLPTIENLMEKASGFADSIMGMDEGTRQTAVNMALMAASAGPLMKSLGYANMGIGKISSSIGGLMQSFAKGGIKDLLGSITNLLGPAGMLAVVAGLGVAAYKIYDIASGAKKAREDLQALNKQAKEMSGIQGGSLWDSGMGPERFGIKTDEIVKGIRLSDKYIIDSAKVLKDGMAKSLENGLIDDALAEKIAKKDGDRLKRLDKNISRLISRGEKRELNEKEKQQLKTYISETVEIQRKYQKNPKDSYNDIQEEINLENRRASISGDRVNKDEQAVDAVKTAIKVRGEYRKALDEEYDAQSKLYEGMKNEAELRAELDKWYKESSLQNEQEYKQFVKGKSRQIIDSEEVQKGKKQLESVYELVQQFNSGTIEKPQFIESLKDLNIDEKGLTSLMTTVLTIKDAGLENEFQDFDISGIISQFNTLGTSIKNIEIPEELKAIKEIFGKNAPEEVLKIVGDLDLKEATKAMTDFKENNKSLVVSLDVNKGKAGLEKELSESVEVGSIFGSNYRDNIFENLKKGAIELKDIVTGMKLPTDEWTVGEITKNTKFRIDANTGKMVAYLERTPVILSRINDEWNKMGPLSETVSKNIISGNYEEAGNNISDFISKLSPEDIESAATAYANLKEKLANGESIGLENEKFLNDINSMLDAINGLKELDINNDILSGFAEQFGEAGAGAGSKLTESLEGSISNLDNVGAKGGQNFGAGVVAGASGMQGPVSAAGAALGGALSAGFNGALKIFSPSKVGRKQAGGYGKGVIKGIKGSAASVRKASAGLGKATSLGYRGSLRISSPSKVAMQDSKWYGEGIKIGLINNMKSIASTSSMVGNMLSSTFKDALDMSIPSLSVPNIASYGMSAMPAMAGNVSINTPQIVVREDADIDRIAKRLNELARRQRSGYGA